MRIDGIDYPLSRLHRYVQVSRALIHKPRSHFKHFSFIVKGTKILSIGWNDTDTITKVNGRVVHYPLRGRHAEAHAIGELNDLNVCRKATLVNIRLNRSKELRNSKPCPICLELIKAMGFKRVYHSIDDGFDLIHL